jgi:diaminopimelate decarboxylase
MKTDSSQEVKNRLPWKRGLERTTEGTLLFSGKDLGGFLTQKVPKTPFYLLSLETAVSRARSYREVLAGSLKQKLHFHFATKSNCHPRLLSALAKEGFGADVVSGGELRVSLQNGFSADHIVFSGVAKSKIEIDQALTAGVGQINVESFPELQRITERAAQAGKKARVAIRINPEVRAETHPYIATGFRENKFGVDLLDLPALTDWILRHPKELEFRGFSLHIGSQLLDFSALQEALEKTLRTEEELRSQGLRARTLDVGGGVGISYRGSEEEDLAILEKYAATLRSSLGSYPNELHFEPGRFWVARAGVLVAQVEYVKRTPHKNFLILNTGMNALIRPMLYQAFHRMEIHPQRNARPELFDVVGPVCESSDVLGTLREFYGPREEDFVCIAEAGAYGSVLSSSYNLLGDVPELIWEDLA